MTKDKDSVQQERSDPSLWAGVPTDFLWGSSTSAYQIEGATQADGRGRSIWDDFSATAGKTYRGETGEIADDHYHRVDSDLDLISELGLNSYCFSIAWPRVIPTGTGAVNKAGLDFYDRLVDKLLARGITPLAKVYHWDLPSCLQEHGGWFNRDTAYALADYAEVVARRLGDRVDRWITHNEPWCTSFLGYALGVHAPGLKDVQQGFVAGHHVLLSHGLAVARIRANTRPTAQVGIALDIYPMHPVDNQPETRHALERADAFRNRWFFDPIFKKRYPEHLFTDFGVESPLVQQGDFDIIGTPIDFLGLNYYSRWMIRAADQGANQPYAQATPGNGSTFTEMGWEIYPEGLLEALERIQQDYAPPAIFITESGAAFPDHWEGGDVVNDPQRRQYIHQHIRSIGQAIAKGIPVKGYFAWSLLDNYEWAEGYSKRFGIIYVDFPTQKRIIKESGRWYASFIAERRNGQNHDS